MSKNGSPFMLSRFEYEPRPLYYLPRDLFEQLERPKPTYIVGTRGTGKTTLLKALNWRERLLNESLRHELGEEPFAKRYIGVYLKLPDTALPAVAKWLSDLQEEQRALLIGLYLDLIWVELLADAVAELVAEEVIAATPDDELQCVKQLMKRVTEVAPLSAPQQLPIPDPGTLRDVARSLRLSRRWLEISALAGEKPLEVFARYSIDQVGVFGRNFATTLADFCNRSSAKTGEGWHFKVCFDEAEGVSPFEQLVLNTIVRLTTTPVFHVVAYVYQPEDLTSTLVRGLYLSEADRQLIILDEMTDTAFKALASGVCNVRVRAKLGTPTARFDVQHCLGRLDINGLLRQILDKSVDPKAKQLLRDAQEYSDASAFKEARADTESGVSTREELPLYQTYLVQSLGLAPPGPGPNWMKRNVDSSKFRKRMVAAYLSLCNQLGAEVRYASAEMVIQMSDNCIRDYLAFLHDIYVEASLPLGAFLQTRVATDIQDAAIKRASRAKRDAVTERVSAPLEIGRLTGALAEVTRIVQTQGPNNRHLSASERGLFTFEISGKQHEKYSEILELILDAGRAGYLRVLEAESPRWRFRVHTSLAAAYGFSYRGAYYPCRVHPEELDALRKIGNQAQFDLAVRSLGARLAGSEDSLSASLSDDLDEPRTLFDEVE